MRKMIEHHQGAVEMSRIVLPQSPTADVAKMAQMTIEKQGKEITDLRKLVRPATPDPASAELYRPAAMQMHNAMMAATGADISETYLRKMLEHHKGGVTMSDVALANGVTGASAHRSKRPATPAEGSRDGRGHAARRADDGHACCTGAPRGEADRPAEGGGAGAGARRPKAGADSKQAGCGCIAHAEHGHGTMLIAASVWARRHSVAAPILGINELHFRVPVLSRRPTNGWGCSSESKSLSGR